MRVRRVKTRQPSDAELRKRIEREAEALVLGCDAGGARRVLRGLKDIELRRETMIAAWNRTPMSPMLRRQRALDTNARCRKYDLLHRIVEVPPHPTRREEALFARRHSR